jgi:hypothetical protein
MKLQVKSFIAAKRYFHCNSFEKMEKKGWNFNGNAQEIQMQILIVI